MGAAQPAAGMDQAEAAVGAMAEAAAMVGAEVAAAMAAAAVLEVCSPLLTVYCTGLDLSFDPKILILMPTALAVFHTIACKVVTIAHFQCLCPISTTRVL